MIKPLRLDDEAAEELEVAACWYEARRPRLGREFIAAFRETCRRIARQPEAWSLVPNVSPDLAVRRCLIRRFPFAVVYVALESELRVLAVAHAHREPGHWRSRL